MKLEIYDFGKIKEEDFERLFEFIKEVSGSEIVEYIDYKAPFSVRDDKEEYELYAANGYRVALARIKGAKRNRYGSPLDVETVRFDSDLFDLFLDSEPNRNYSGNKKENER